MSKQLCFRLLLLASAIATSLSAAAYSFESAGIYYNITGNNTVEVTYSDRNNNTYSGSVSIPETVTNNGTEYSVTTIGESAFKGSAVTSVSMPEGITSIDYDAFYECENLESVTLPESLTTLGSDAFYFCKSLKAVKIPSGVTAIPGSCFYCCSSLESVTIPEGVMTIGQYAFYSCELLKTIKIPSKVTAIPGSCFCGCSSLESVTIPEGVTTIGEYAFFGCNHKELTLPSTVTMIESGAFVSNNRFQSITCNATTPPSLGENVFGYNAFATVKVPLSSIATYRQAEGWKNFTNYYGGEVINNGITYRINEKEAMVAAAEATLTEANIPSSVEFEGNQYPVIKINDKVFFGNANLIVVTLPESLTTLGREAFSFCKSLKTIKIPSGVTAIPVRCFYGCSSLESVTIPVGVTDIGGAAFSGCNLKALTLPESLEAIGYNAFSGNRSLKSVNIPTKVKTIEEHAFSYCGLTDLVIQEGVQTIGNAAFLYNNNLKSIICNAATPSTLGDNAFDSSIKPDVKVPLSSIAAYRQAEGWKNFTNYYGEEVAADGITYRINEKEAVVAAADSSLTEANIPSVVEFEGNQYPVIKINDEVFFGNANLIVVTLPESLTTLGDRAFYTCKSLKTIKIPSGVTAIPDYCFNHCLSLESVTIPEGVTTIGDGAFFGCNLKELTLPSTVTMIEIGAFLSNNRCQSITCNATTPPNLGENVFGYNASTTVKVPLQSIAAYRQAEGWKGFANYYGGEMIADGITYRIDDNGAMVAVAEATLTEANIPSSVEFEGNQYPVIKINDRVFSGNTNLTSVTLPESLTTLGDRAFYTCKSLKTIKIPSGVTAIPGHCFDGCSSLESVTIPEGVMTIGDVAFYACSINALTLPESLEKIGIGAFCNNCVLKSVNIPAKVKTIGASAFSVCGLTDLVIPEGVQTIDGNAFSGNSLQNLTLPSTITSIGESAFSYNNNLQSITCNAATPPTLGDRAFYSDIELSIKVPLQSITAYRQANGWKDYANYYGAEMVVGGITYWIKEDCAEVAAAEATLTEANIPSSVEFEGNQYPVIKINDEVFSGNTNLTTVTLPEGLVEIGVSAFKECKNLESVTLPESLTTLGGEAFRGNTNLTTVTLPAGLVGIGVSAFYGCKNLESVTLPESLTTLGSRSFESCQSLKTIKIPSGVTAIPDHCFEGCSSLESVTIPEGVTDIGAYAFSCCNLNALTLPESLETIGSIAFNGNRSLKSVNIPAKVKTIESYAFASCGLTDLVIQEGVQVIEEYTFINNSLKNLTLPSTITSIGESVFYDNYYLQLIICNAATPPTLGDNAFDSDIKPDVKVPISSIAAYKQANGWKDFSNYYGGDVVNNGITYRIDENGATITAAEATLAEANIPSAVEFEGNQHPVKKINDNVFSGNTNLTAVTLPEGLVEIGASAFKGCQNLASVTLPESLTTVGNYAFNDCRLLKAIKIPLKVTAIPCYCFNACSSLESVTIPEGVTTIGSFAFQSCNLNALTLPESLEAIENSAFSGNQSLKSVNIPAKVKTIGAWAFYGCGLKDLVIQEGVQTIGNYAFFNNSLQNLTLPSTITSIGKEAFNCYSGYLQSITCNAATPPTLGDNAFSSGIMPSIKVPLASIAAYRQADGWKNISEYYVYEVISDGVTYRIDDKAAYVRAVDKTVSEICLAENVAFEGAQYPLYKIADNAFAGNGSITLVTVPATVEAIGSNAFDGITYPIIKIKATTPPVLASKLPMLSAIVPPASVKAYKAANYWKDMTIIGEGKNDIEVTTSATVDLTEAIMTQAKITPASVTSIKVHGPLTNDDIINALNTNMRSCYAIDLSDAEIEALPDGAFNGKIGLLEITLPAGLKAIGNNAFRGCFALRNEVTIPAGVQTIGSYAFSGCRNAKFNPALPETLTAIGDYAFQNCANLYAVRLPASLQTIGEYAFYASSIQEIVLPEGLFSLGDGAFWFCKALETADFVNSMDIISIPSNAFNGCSGLRKVYLPFFVEEIGDYAFSGCKSLKSLNFFECEEITKIGEFAFRGCRSLKSLDLFKCENLTTIGSRAFSGCTSLKSLNLPKSLETIGEYAFSGCQAISVISSPSLVPPTIASESALNGIDKDVCVLTMPKSVYLDYFRAPYWGQFVEYTASVLVGVDGQGSVMYSNNFGTAPTPVKVAAFYATAGEGDGVEEDEGDGITAEAYDSANICAKDNSTLTFRIVPDEGNER